MDIEIRELTPGLAEDYARFFDVTPHDDRSDKEQLPCYCVTWRTPDTYECDENGNWNHWFKTREERRERAIQFIKAGSLRGYLAYCGGRIVGWCNANADCRGCVDYLRAYYPIEEYDANVKIQSVFCFVVAPDMQRKGVATALLARVCEDAAAVGFDFVEAYANAEHTPTDYGGPLAMYEKCGFVRSAERDGKIVVRKTLK